MTRRIAAVAAVVSLSTTVIAACTPHQIETFHSLTPGQQNAVVKHLSRPTDCYSALRYFPGDKTKARRIIRRESRNQPTARNPHSSARGCWQLLAMHNWRYRAVGCSPAQWSDPRCNTLAAAHLYREAGWQPWAL